MSVVAGAAPGQTRFEDQDGDQLWVDGPYGDDIVLTVAHDTEVGMSFTAVQLTPQDTLDLILTLQQRMQQRAGAVA